MTDKRDKPSLRLVGKTEAPPTAKELLERAWRDPAMRHAIIDFEGSLYRRGMEDGARKAFEQAARDLESRPVLPPVSLSNLPPMSPLPPFSQVHYMPSTFYFSDLEMAFLLGAGLVAAAWLITPRG
jgi:hypothetical protein